MEGSMDEVSVPFSGQEGKGHPRQGKNLYKVKIWRLEKEGGMFRGQERSSGGYRE